MMRALDFFSRICYSVKVKESCIQPIVSDGEEYNAGML